MQPRGHVPFGHGLAHRIVLLGHGTQAVDNTANAVLVQHQPIQHGRRKPLFAAKRHVLFVGRDDLRAIFPDRLGGSNQGRVFALGGRECQFARSRFCTGADFIHQGGYVGQVFHASSPSTGSHPLFYQIAA